MKTIYRPHLCLAAALAAGLSAQAARAAEDPPAILEVRRAYQDCRAVPRAKDAEAIELYGVFRDLTTQSRPTWRRHPPAAAEKLHLLEWMTVHKAGGLVRAARLLENTPSGDWSKDSEYCFRADGSLAFVLAELRTFQGNVRVEDRLYHDPAGRRLRSLRSVFDLDSGRRIDPGDPRFRGFHDRETRLYLTTRALAAELGPALPGAGPGSR